MDQCSSVWLAMPQACPTLPASMAGNRACPLPMTPSQPMPTRAAPVQSSHARTWCKVSPSHGVSVVLCSYLLRDTFCLGGLTCRPVDNSVNNPSSRQAETVKQTYTRPILAYSCMPITWPIPRSALPCITASASPFIAPTAALSTMPIQCNGLCSPLPMAYS
jgi:hypothetical protein